MTAQHASALEARAALEALSTSIASGVGADRLRGYAGCLTPLLAALDWRGDARQVAEALPHAALDLDRFDFQNILARLGYESHLRPAQLREAAAMNRPCLFIPRTGAPRVVLKGGGDNAWIFDSDTGVYDKTDLSGVAGDVSGRALFPKALEEKPAKRATPWFSDLLGRFRGLILAALLLTFGMSLLSLAAPLGVMAIYINVLPYGVATMLPYIVAGVVLCLGTEFLLRTLRARIQAHVSGRMDYLIATAAFDRVLRLPATASASASVGDQAARLRSFQAIRDFFSSPLAGVALELPFLPVSLLALAVVAGPVALAPAVALVAYLAIGYMALKSAKRVHDGASTARSARHAFTVEMLQQMTAIKLLGAETVWLERFRDISGQSATASYRSAKTEFLIQDCSHVVMVLAGIATLGAAVLAVLAGSLHAGALIAVMALTWRVLAPIQGGLKLISNFEKLRATAKHLNAMMRLPLEKQQDAHNFESKIFDGHIRCHNVSLRYGPNAAPALSGVTFDAPPGQFIAIAGNSGSGKSSLLKVILRIYQAQLGAVFVDGLDIRQLPPSEFRQAVAYMPQNPTMFYGTISQNLRLYKPSASQAELETVCADVGILADIQKLPEGFYTRVGDRSSVLPSPFVKSLAIAGALLRGSNILLIDEAHDGLDDAAERRFLDVLARLHGKATILMVTHRPSHMRMADRVLRLDEGRLVADGPPAAVIPTLFGAVGAKPAPARPPASDAKDAPARETPVLRATTAQQRL